ncbi:MAG: bifunctional oligoribonuclease/PAP phosphatase NrnA [Clostridia bacterium]|nr:bifunctional oligoribonuclease/PAP phosphatase NrnA [Clostridia bacterium]
MNPLSYLLTRKSVALLPHISTDWDAMGSCMAIRTLLRDKGIKADVILPDALAPHLSFMETDVLVFNENETYNYETICGVDVSTAERLGANQQLFEQCEDKVWIDHHISDKVYAPINRVEPDAAATAEVIYSMMQEDSIPLTKKVAEYLYLALASDTGSFRYQNTRPFSARMLGALIEAGADVSALSNELFFNSTYSLVKLRGEAIGTIELFASGKVGTAFITKAMMEKVGATRNDAGALADVPRSIGTVCVSAVIKEEDDGFSKVSFRSKGNYNVERIAALFGGGGHEKAAGATIYGSVEEVRELILPHLIKAVE